MRYKFILSGFLFCFLSLFLSGTAFAESAFVTSYSPITTVGGGTASYWVGMKFTVGGSDISVKSLGRLKLSQNSRSHTLKLIDVQTGSELGSVNVSLSSGTAGQFVYTTLSSPITLAAGKSYYLVSSEAEGQDWFYDQDMTVSTLSDATVNNAVWSANGTSGWTLYRSTNNSWGPVNFTYDVVSSQSGGGSTPPPSEPTDTLPPSISGVSTSNISQTGATISWSTNESANSQVEYGTTSGYGTLSSLLSSLTSSHSVTLSNLSPGTTYNYRVRSRDAAGNLNYSGNYTFSTTPSSSGGSSSGGSSSSNYNITSYGAKCNGSDDASAVQAAINALPNGATLEVPCMASIGSAGLRIANKSNITILGTASGAGFRALSTTGQNIPYFANFILVLDSCTTCTVKNLEFNANNFGVGGIGFTRSTDTLIEGNYIHDVGIMPAGGAISSTYNTRSRVVRNTVTNTQRHPTQANYGTRGFWLGNGGAEENDLYVGYNTLTNIGSTGIATHAYGLVMENNTLNGTTDGSCAKVATHTSQSQIVRNNIFKGCFFNGLQISDETSPLRQMSNVVVKNNIIESNASVTQGPGIAAYAKLVNSEISNNTIFNNNRGSSNWFGGILSLGGSNLTIKDNKFYDTKSSGSQRQDAGIFFSIADTSDNINVINNEFSSHMRYGIIVEDKRSTSRLSSMNIQSNVFKNNSIGGIYVSERNAGTLNGISLSGNCFVGNGTNIQDNRGSRALSQQTSSQNCTYPINPISNPPSTPSTPSLPSILSFSASPSTITSGNSTTLSWSTSGATSLSINQGVGTVSGTSRLVSPTQTTTYTLTATNSGGSVTSSITVTVNAPSQTTPPTTPTPTSGIAVDSTFANYSPSFIDDGLINAAGGIVGTWASADNANPHWIEIPLSSATQINKVDFYWAFNAYQQKYMTSQTVDVQALINNSYQTVATFRYSGNGEPSSSITFNPVTTSKLRFYQPAFQGPLTYNSILWLTEIDYSYVAPSSSSGGQTNGGQNGSSSGNGSSSTTDNQNNGSGSSTNQNTGSQSGSSTSGSTSNGSNTSGSSSTSSGSGSTSSGSTNTSNQTQSSGSSSGSGTSGSSGSSNIYGVRSSTGIVTRAAPITSNLFRGSKNDEVLRLQNFLTERGYLTSDNATGFFGPATEEAVKKFQAAENIVSSGGPLSTGYGFVGPTTRARINSYLSNSPITPTYSENTLSAEQTTTLRMQILMLQQQVLQLILRLRDLQSSSL